MNAVKFFVIAAFIKVVFNDIISLGWKCNQNCTTYDTCNAKYFIRGCLVS